MKQSFIYKIFLFVFLLAGCRATQIQSEEAVQEAALPDDFNGHWARLELPPEDADLPVTTFREIWAYLIAGREGELKQNFPLSDVGYFGAELDSYGKLVNVPDPKKISWFAGRVHLVVTSGSRSLTYFALMEGSNERRELVKDLLEAAKSYSGIQIDFENIPQRSGDSFLSFLAELRAGLNGKMLTIALPARTRSLADDVYDYRKILPLVDRIFVMAYDEHWSTSEPGPIASMDWCRRVASYSLDTVGSEKLIMGLPFYGRTWGDMNPFRAFYHSGIERIKNEQGITEVARAKGIPYFHYNTTVKMTVYYEDAYSLSTRLEMYSGMGVAMSGFWCLGQETPSIWSLLNLNPRYAPE